MSASTSRRRVSYGQLEALWEFLNSNRNIALGFNKSAQARHTSRRFWSEVAENLNSFGDGASKDWKSWSAYWVDYKGKLKRKCAAIRASRTGTGGGPSSVTELTEIELKFLTILGEDYGSGLPGIQVDPFPDSDITCASPSTLSSTIIFPTLAQENQDVAREILPQPNNTEPMLELEMGLAPSINATEIVVDHNTTPPQPVSEGPVARPLRRQRRRQVFTQEAARRALVEATQQRVQNDARTLDVLTRIADILQQIVTRLHSDSTTDAL